MLVVIMLVLNIISLLVLTDIIQLKEPRKKTRDTKEPIYEHLAQITHEPDYETIQPPNEFSIMDLPRDLSGLSIHQVGKCLRQLNLGKYVDMFQSQQVDGQILGELDEDMLTKDFSMTRFEVAKLLKFVKEGWRPNHREALCNS